MTAKSYFVLCKCSAAIMQPYCFMFDIEGDNQVGLAEDSTNEVSTTGMLQVTKQP